MNDPLVRKAVRSLAIIFALLATSSCAKTGAQSTDTLSVVTAFYPIEFATRRVGGTFVDVTNLTPPGGEPHDLELKPSDLTAIHAAQLVLYFNEGFQPAVDDAIESIADKSKVVDLLAGLPLKPPVGDGEEELKIDPHVWLSPVIMQKLAVGVTEALVTRLPSQALEIQTAGRALAADLSALDQEFRSKLSACERRELFTSHAAFAYLASEYGLRQIPISGLTPEAEPSSKRLQEIARQASAAHATTIFFETLVSPRVSETVARSVGAKTAVLDPLEGLSEEDIAEGADYFSVMRENLATLVEALDCKT